VPRTTATPKRDSNKALKRHFSQNAIQLAVIERARLKCLVERAAAVRGIVGSGASRCPASGRHRL
jgi:hypothetical protein